MNNIKKGEVMSNREIEVKAKKSGNLAIIKCPYCGDEHVHGWVSGFRVPHCMDKKHRDKPNYYIICNDSE